MDPKKERYYLDEEGILQDDGWFKIENVNASTQVVTENWYYAQPSGAVLKDGYHDIDGKTYYFDVNGYNYRKRWITLPSGDKRYLGEDGVMKRDEWFVISVLIPDFPITIACFMLWIMEISPWIAGTRSMERAMALIPAV